MDSIFKDKTEEKRASITDLEVLVILITKLLKQDLNRLVKGMELVEL
jgi:hypothetical protein